MLNRTLPLLLAALFALLVVAPVAAQEPAAAARLRAFAHQAEEGEHAAATASPAQLGTAYEALHADWAGFEDAVREADPGGYMAIEGAIATLRDVTSAAQPETAAAASAFAAVEHAALEVADRIAGGGATGAATEPATIASFATDLDAATQALAAGNPAAAAAQLEAASRAWPAVEGMVAASSPATYRAIELDLAAAAAALAAMPTDTGAASAALTRLSTAVAPFVAEAPTYTAFDAAAILLREGLEALLVIVALLAFLRRSGNNDKRGWIWAGGVAGIVASIVAGVALHAIFSAASAGQNRELVEGVIGLAAAAMLFSVAYWLHSKASLGAWRRYIDQRTSQALASGSLFGLALLAFLAVFREGAETVVFYLGIAPSIGLRELIVGFGMGAVALAVVAVLLMVFSVRLPLRQFFQVAGLLVYYLGFKFVGTGIHALQVASALPSTPAPIPAVPFLAIYPTWETLVPQLLLIAAAVAALRYLRVRDQRALTAQSA